MNPHSNGYVFFTDNKIYDFLYLKLSQEKLQKALPISYDKNINKSYLTVIFDNNGRDYLCQSSFKDIQESVDKMNMISLIDNDYRYVKTYIPNLSLTEYDIKKIFYKTQLK